MIKCFTPRSAHLDSYCLIRTIVDHITNASHTYYPLRQFNQYGNSRAVPNMLLPTGDGGISPKGTFWFFAVVTVIGGLWVWVSVPETAGRTLESMDRLFALPWYRIGLYGNRDAAERDLVLDAAAGKQVEAEVGTAEHVEVQGDSSRV